MVSPYHVHKITDLVQSIGTTLSGRRERERERERERDREGDKEIGRERGRER